MPVRLTLLTCVLLVPASFLFAMLNGSVDISASEFIRWLSQPGVGDNSSAILELRLPRALSALTVGALLAGAGLLMQVLLRNPLADPYIMGVSGGAAVATMLAMLLSFSGAWLTGSAVAGACIATLLVILVAHGQGGWTPLRLLLSGVILAFGWAAMISFILAISPTMQLRGMLYWLMGDLSAATLPVTGMLVLLISSLLLLPHLRSLNILLLGDDQAKGLGIDTRRSQLALFSLASLMTASAVTIAGSVGFIGLVIPHLLRLTGMSDHRLLFPSALCSGGALLCVADTLSRTLVAPVQLPVGVLMALLGVPLFLLLLYRNKSL